MIVLILWKSRVEGEFEEPNLTELRESGPRTLVSDEWRPGADTIYDTRYNHSAPSATRMGPNITMTR